MKPHDVADMLDAFAHQVERIRGVSRFDMHAFIEDKSDAVGALRAKARELRTVPAIAKPMPIFIAGSVEVGRRSIVVEVRRRRA